MFRALVVIAALALIALSAHFAWAHQLDVDRLSLWPHPEAGTLRGQLLFDPELTRALDDPADERASARVLEFVRRELIIEVDGKPLELEPELRELWTRSGAVPGDSVMIDARLPPHAHQLVVRAPARMKQLLVVIALPVDQNQKSETASTLVAGGGTTPPFQLGKEPPAGARASARRSAFAYLGLGFRHVLPFGLDHMLFIVALVLGSDRKWRRMLLMSGAFTLAHTVTLGLGATGLVTIPGRVVEPFIALSIAVVALLNLWRRGHQHEPWVVLAFGLLHGLGFARALGETGLPANAVAVPLLCFNSGVELAQLVVVATCWLLLRSVDERRLYTHVVRPGSLFIAVAGLFWAVQRVL
jgi:hypothetical protein